jgi:UDP-N-acetylmuramoyl-L-alanyl-D-glutamate--2,6-diaminopimelate ligase
MKLSQLLKPVGLALVHGDGDLPIGDLVDDSRQATPGCAFLARSASGGDGRSFIADAIARGAVAVVTESAAPADVPAGVAHAVAPRVDQALAGRLAEVFFDHPSDKLKLIGITGTNGKTTIALLIQHLLRKAGIATGVIGTIYVDDGSQGGRREATLTTPGAIDFSRYLARMVACGCKAAVAEVSSHALDQGRTAGLRFDVAVFTNLTGDHLDYHGDMNSYAHAKAKLFADLSDDAWAVVNADDAYGQRMLQSCRANVIRTTLNAGSDGATALALIHELTASYSDVRFDGPWGRCPVRLPLIGRHNVSNALQALTAANAVTDLSQHMAAALATCPQVPGRLQRVEVNDHAPHGHGATATPTVLVDYAHTHDALENVLTALRPVTPGRLIALFGCGGDRDKTKRPKMAQVACRLADQVYITSDNPRTEDPQTIIADIVRGVPANQRDAVTVVADRAAAIADCIASTGPGDTVLLAGKGHETYQIVGREKRHFDDREQAQLALQAWMRQRAGRCGLIR